MSDFENVSEGAGSNGAVYCFYKKKQKTMTQQTTTQVHNLIASIQRLVRTAYIYPLQKSKEFDLTLSQNRVIKNLAENGSLSSADLSRKLLVSPSNITGIIDRLEKKKLVQRIRKKEDRRVNLIRLTPEGEKIGQYLPDPYEKKIGANLKQLNPDQIHELSMAVKQIISLIEYRHTEQYDLPAFANKQPRTKKGKENNGKGTS